MLSRFPNKTLKVGAKVSLSPESRMLDERYGSGRRPCNPLGVVGRVARVDSYGVYVAWSNYDCGDVYYETGDYDLIAEGEPGFLATE